MVQLHFYSPVIRLMLDTAHYLYFSETVNKIEPSQIIKVFIIVGLPLREKVCIEIESIKNSIRK